jgi:hypothetical protein
VIVVGVLAAAVAAWAAPANATSECRGLNPCVPVAGPWVVVPAGRALPRAQVQYQLTCPNGFIVGGVDAELADRSIDVSIVGTVGAPVSPGVTTSRNVVFVASYVGSGGGPPPTFRPHAGCIPATGGGQRTPTGLAAVTPPGEPTTRRVRTARVGTGGTLVTAKCRRDERLVAAYVARAFATPAPPGGALVASLTAKQRVQAGGIVVGARGGRGQGIVQVAALCAAGGG